MSETSASVTFANPPVNEVAFSVQLDGAAIDEVAVLADYWPLIRDDFPGHQKQPPVAPLVEDFAVPPAQTLPFGIGFIAGAPPVRYWFVSSDETRLVQVQADRFAYNWRQVKGNEDYPRYATLRPEFESRFVSFVEALRERPSPAWCELTYINHIEAPGQTAGTHGPLATILRALNPEVTSPSLPAIEDTQLQQRFRIPSEHTGDPIGRFYITAVPGYRTRDAAPIYVVNLIARARLEERSTEGVVAFFDRAHEFIVSGFKESTSALMHERWGLVE
jgi:uncharacterized protein (TIGR04255 family)